MISEYFRERFFQKNFNVRSLTKINILLYNLLNNRKEEKNVWGFKFFINANYYLFNIKVNFNSSIKILTRMHVEIRKTSWNFHKIKICYILPKDLIPEISHLQHPVWCVFYNIVIFAHIVFLLQVIFKHKGLNYFLINYKHRYWIDKFYW